MLHVCPIALTEFKEQSTSAEAHIIKNVPEFYETWKLKTAAPSTPPPPPPRHGFRHQSHTLFDETKRMATDISDVARSNSAKYAGSPDCNEVLWFPSKSRIRPMFSRSFSDH